MNKIGTTHGLFSRKYLVYFTPIIETVRGEGDVALKSAHVNG